MAIKIDGNEVISDNRKVSLASVNPGVYTSSNRPSNPAEGDIIFNSEEGVLQVFNGTDWV